VGVHTGRADMASSMLVPLPGTAWLAAASPALSLALSPLTIALCTRKSTRLTAVVGGLVAALGCLFTSFASQAHQAAISYGLVLGVGAGMVADSASLMVGQYFKRRREMVEVLVVSARGLGTAAVFLFIRLSIRSVGWRLGLQALTGLVFSTFILGLFYRSATLYHPQRRAILHLKTQKKKIKEKNKSKEDRKPMVETKCLRSRTVQIMLGSAGLAGLGLHTPTYSLAWQLAEFRGTTLLPAVLCLASAWCVGCCLAGILVTRRLARQSIAQASCLACGLSILGLALAPNYTAHLALLSLYSCTAAAYCYSTKMFLYQKVRARNFGLAWGWVQCAQAVPTLLSLPVSCYLTRAWGSRASHFLSAACLVIASAALSLIGKPY